MDNQLAILEYNKTNEVELNIQEYTTDICMVKVQSGTKEATIKLVVK